MYVCIHKHTYTYILTHICTHVDAHACTHTFAAYVCLVPSVVRKRPLRLELRMVVNHHVGSGN